jgi:hypothetical protein
MKTIVVREFPGAVSGVHIHWIYPKCRSALCGMLDLLVEDTRKMRVSGFE